MTSMSLSPVDCSPPESDIKKATEVVRVLYGAVKNYALYPENHAVSQKFINDFKTCLDEFVKSTNDLKLDVKKDCLLYRGAVVHQSQSTEEDLAFLLFRDGVEWIEFQEGLASAEIRLFFRILDRFRYQKQESENDLVTAFWEAEFTSIQYSASYAIYEESEAVDLASFKASEKPVLDIKQMMQAPEDEGPPDMASLDHSLWKLTPEEMALTREMVAEESRRNPAEEMLRVLPVLVSRQDAGEDLPALLQFMSKGLHEIVEQGRFDFSAEFLKRLRIIQQDFRKSHSPDVALLDEFFMEISSTQFLDALCPGLSKINLDKSAVDALKRTLFFLAPKAVLALGPILLQIPDQKIRPVIMDSMVLLARRDVTPLIRLLKRPEEALVLMAVRLLGRIEGEAVSEALLKMVQHPSSHVRKAAVSVLTRRDRQLLVKLFDLIEDPDDDIRDVLLDCLSDCRGDIAETLLRDYLQHRQYKRRDRSHLMACYTGLGQCATACSLPFLKETLFCRAWLAGLGQTIHRQGAAAALKKMEIQEAREILAKAAHSLSIGVRRASRKVEGEDE